MKDMALEMAVKESLKILLREEKNRLEGELSRIATPMETQGEYQTRFEDLGREEGDSETETEMYVDALGVEKTLEQNLEEVTNALSRLETGTYGVCAVCGEDIVYERLLAYPSATTCVRDASKE